MGGSADKAPQHEFMLIESIRLINQWTTLLNASPVSHRSCYRHCLAQSHPNILLCSVPFLWHYPWIAGALWTLVAVHTRGCLLCQQTSVFVLIPATHWVCTLVFASPEREVSHSELSTAKHDRWRKCFPGLWQVEKGCDKLEFREILQVLSQGVEPEDLSTRTYLFEEPW